VLARRRRYDAVVNGRYLKSTIAACPSPWPTGLIGFQDDKLPRRAQGPHLHPSSPSTRWPPSSPAPRTETSTPYLTNPHRHPPKEPPYPLRGSPRPRLSRGESSAACYLGGSPGRILPQHACTSSASAVDNQRVNPSQTGNGWSPTS
jgi:hypothetical protein